jgi:hypothetical protein
MYVYLCVHVDLDYDIVFLKYYIQCTHMFL